MLVLIADNLWVTNKFIEQAAWPLNPSPRHDFHLERQLSSGFLLDDGKPEVFRARSPIKGDVK